ncbi:MAG TPA: class I SAM-dependent methyltransferase [Actinomycetota bacterium]|nr:class I SAM-dependent methyltransferase [Actinomycetota bacterium]
MDDTAPASDLILTGERTLPGIPEENYWFQRHVVAYRHAADRIAGMNVLDAGCGEGYGSAMLAEHAASVVGVDLERDVIEHAAERYPNVRFQTGDLATLGFPDASFDAVVTFQVIEHMQSPRGFLTECGRVLRPGGLLVLSTPNRLTFSPAGVRNPFHTVEFAPAELRSVLEDRFVVQLLGGTFHRWRLDLVERMMRASLPERLISQPVPEWPAWLRRVVTAVTPRDFVIRESHVERSLDLIAVARRR